MNNGISMKAILVSGMVGLCAIATAISPAEARDGRNAAAAAGAIGGLAAGAAIGAAASQPRYYDPAPRRTYYAPVRERRVIVDEGDEEDCVVRTRRVYVNGAMRVRRVTVCD